MREKIPEKFRHINLNFLTKLAVYGFFIAVLVLTVLIWIDAPVQYHFKNLRKNDVWFGGGWQDVLTGEGIETYGQRSMRVRTDGGRAVIEKTFDFSPGAEEYMCFRVRSVNTTVYVNGKMWYTYQFKDKYKTYGRRMYMLHQMSAEGIKEGDRITMELNTDARDGYTVLQLPAVGDRYALVMYLLRESKGSLVICAAALIIILLMFIVIHSEIFINKEQDAISLRWLISFIGLSVIYIGMDCGCIEILTKRISIANWFGNLSLIMLPIPFIMFVRCAFFPGHKRYTALAFINLFLAAASVVAFTVYARSMSDFYGYVHVLIVLDIVACIASFVEERTMPSPEVLLGFGAIIASVGAGVVCYWNEVMYTGSIIYGYGLLTFGACMLVWIVRSRHDINRMRAEADHFIMERDKAAAQEESEQKSRFLISMSHEIRTPLNAMLGLNELIMHDTTDSRIRKHSMDIQAAGRTLLALINDVLDFSKIQSGKLEILPTDYSLSLLLDDIVAIMHERVTGSGLQLRLDIDGTLPDMLCGDEARIKQIIMNLMTNAVKYTKEGWIELGVGRQSVSKHRDDGSVMLDIRVSDSGIGIKKEDLSKIFVEFERLDRIKNRSIEGTGLGLGITSRLTGLMGGKISVESEYGSGSTFRVCIPQRVVSDTPVGDYKKRFERIGSEDGDTLPETMNFPGKRVFVVDDNEMNLEVIASILEMLGVEVERADGGRSAIERLDREAYDLILTDDMMPEISGTDMMLYLHSNAKSASHKTPIVVLTANAISGARENYIKNGFDEYMTKPVDVEVLQKILMRYLK